MNIDQLAQTRLRDMQRLLAAREVSPVEIVQASVDQIEDVNIQINALYDLRVPDALAEAKAADERYKNGSPIGPFDGFPVTIKDSVNAVGMRWFHGSAVHGDGVVATKDSPPTTRLKAAGAIILGKGAMPDFGLSGSGVSGSHGVVRNPWGLEWNTGGSSAGGAASLAAGIGMMSVGSDIAGSVRLPASHCGLASLKPTQGVIPHAPASTVRSAGPMTRYACDLQAWTELLQGPDDEDRYSVSLANPFDGQDPRIGASSDFGFGPAVEPAVQACFDRVKDVLGSLTGPVRDVTARAENDAYLAIDDSLKIKGWQEFANASPEHRCKTPDELYRWFKDAEHWTPAKLAEINRGIEQGVRFCARLFEDVDILLTPVMPIVNFPAERRGIDPAMPMRHTTFTALFNQSGYPAASICAGFDKRGLPIGIQIVGRRFDDLRVLDIATKLEAALDVFGSAHRQWPTKPIARCKEGGNDA